MRTDKNLKAELLKRLKVTPQRLSQRVNRMKKDNGPMSTAEATYVIAHQEGLDLTKYLDSKTVEKVRVLVPQAGSAPTGSPQKRSRKARPGISVIVTGQSPKVEQLLPESIAKDAQLMARVYPVYYVLENLLRIVISKTMEKAHGKDWWSRHAPSDVVRDVAGRRDKENKAPWHGKRGATEIYYSDFGDLRAIIEKNWNDFKDLFPSRPWITQRLDELEHPRNVMAHHNPVSKEDRARLELYFRDLVAQFKSKKEVLS